MARSKKLNDTLDRILAGDDALVPKIPAADMTSGQLIDALVPPYPLIELMTKEIEAYLRVAEQEFERLYKRPLGDSEADADRMWDLMGSRGRRAYIRWWRPQRRALVAAEKMGLKIKRN